MGKRQAISQLLEDEGITPQQKAKLENVLRIRKFASSHLALPDNNSYTSYVDLEREYVTWAVFAAPELSMQAETWCFWVVGCVPYRGYFDEQKANKFARQLEARELETYIAPIPAYSTLGWFSDPVLSTMLRRGELVTAEYIFHELAHQKLYIKDDSNFNEAFASAIGRMGVITWLQSQNKNTELQKYLQSNQRKQQIYQMLEVLRNDLTEIYNAPLSVAQKRKQKQTTLAQYKQTVTNKTESWGQYDVYKNWLLQDINNARLNALSTYQALVPAFITLFEQCDNNFGEFYRVVESMQPLTKQQRLDYLQLGDCR